MLFFLYKVKAFPIGKAFFTIYNTLGYCMLNPRCAGLLFSCVCLISFTTTCDVNASTSPKPSPAASCNNIWFLAFSMIWIIIKNPIISTIVTTSPKFNSSPRMYQIDTIMKIALAQERCSSCLRANSATKPMTTHQKYLISPGDSTHSLSIREVITTKMTMVRSRLNSFVRCSRILTLLLRYIRKV